MAPERSPSDPLVPPRSSLLLPLVGIAATSLLSSSALAHGGTRIRQTERDLAERFQPQTERSSGIRVYLHGQGGEVRGGAENASRNRSSVVGSRGFISVDVPAYTRGSSAWRSLVRCVESKFTDFDVEIVDERPTNGSYIMAMVGGEPGMLGFRHDIGGVAPYNGKVIDHAVVFVFERNISDARGQCEATAHEIGHALGLDHSTLCSDLMSYGSCGPKTFRDRSSACGEGSERGCLHESSSQNTHERLAAHVGLRPAEPDPVVAVADPPRRVPPSKPPVRASPPVREPRSEPSGSASPPVREPVRQRPAQEEIATAEPSGPDRTGPRLRVLRPSSVARARVSFEVKLQTRDTSGIARVELLWSDGITYERLRCGDASLQSRFSCRRSGEEYSLEIAPGAGDRYYAIAVTDGAGNVTTSPVRKARFR